MKTMLCNISRNAITDCSYICYVDESQKGKLGQISYLLCMISLLSAQASCLGGGQRS